MKLYKILYIILSLFFMIYVYNNSKNDRELMEIVYFIDELDSIEKISVLDTKLNVKHDYVVKKEITDLINQFDLLTTYIYKIKKDVLTDEFFLAYELEFWNNEDILLYGSLYVKEDATYYNGDMISFNYNGVNYLLVLNNKLCKVKVNY